MGTLTLLREHHLLDCSKSLFPSSFGMSSYPEKEEKKKWKDLKLMKKLERQQMQEEQTKRQEEEEAAAQREDQGEHIKKTGKIPANIAVKVSPDIVIPTETHVERCSDTILRKWKHLIHVPLDLVFLTPHRVLNVLSHQYIWIHSNKLYLLSARTEVLQSQGALSYTVRPVVTSDDGDSGNRN